jgi:hypothetical protein
MTLVRFSDTPDQQRPQRLEGLILTGGVEAEGNTGSPGAARVRLRPNWDISFGPVRRVNPRLSLDLLIGGDVAAEGDTGSPGSDGASPFLPARRLGSPRPGANPPDLARFSKVPDQERR